MAKTKSKAEFGDFQTPLVLAQQVCEIVRARISAPASILEPTCGIGGLLVTSANVFPEAQRLVGKDISPVYVAELENTIAARPDRDRFLVQVQDYFKSDWAEATAQLPAPLLVIGNPPWVTNSELSTWGSENKPMQTNFQNFKGLDALTGKSNFDISEWMLLDMLRWLNGRDATLAMLVKTSVARKALAYAWKNDLAAHEAAIYQIEALKHFGAAVDACLFICRTSIPAAPAPLNCQVYTSLSSAEPKTVLSYQQGQLIANGPCYEQWRHLQGKPTHYQWRSGIKHDCSKIMELRVEPNAPAGTYRNGLGEVMQLESTYVLPMLKTSEVANNQVQQPERRMVVPQRTTGEATDTIEQLAPATWSYLQRHGGLLDGRQSTIYKKRPRFSVFGIGDYSFKPWKVAISGLYKHLHFAVIGPYEGQPVVLDDTTYFLGCQTEAEARFLAELLNSKVATAFLGAFIFWDAKRPVTVDLLQRLDLCRLAQELGRQAEYEVFNKPAQPRLQRELF